MSDTESEAERRMMRRSEQIPREHSLADMTDWAIQRGLDPEKVHLSGGGHLVWASPATDEEERERRQHAKRAAARQEEYERAQYVRLHEKYGKENA